jgi:hypothetical protein
MKFRLGISLLLSWVPWVLFGGIGQGQVEVPNLHDLQCPDDYILEVVAELDTASTGAATPEQAVFEALSLAAPGWDEPRLEPLLPVGNQLLYAVKSHGVVQGIFDVVEMSEGYKTDYYAICGSLTQVIGG